MVKIILKCIYQDLKGSESDSSSEEERRVTTREVFMTFDYKGILAADSVWGNAVLLEPSCGLENSACLVTKRCYVCLCISENCKNNHWKGKTHVAW